MNELFPTIQGEAYWTGTPATFIRLQGCPVGCPWCDTKHTWPQGTEASRITAAQLLSKGDPAPSWAEMTVEEIIAAVEALPPRHFVITGGEPFAQDIEALTEALAGLGQVQVETSGTHQIRAYHRAWITVSPKVAMPGGLQVLPEALARADEVKMPVERQGDIDALRSILEGVDPHYVWLQPVSQDPSATGLCIKSCMKYGWRLSIQTHKFAGLR